MNTFLSTKINAYKIRFIVVVMLFILALIVLIGRVIYLHIWRHDFLLTQGDARTLRVVSTPVYRGTITDRHGEPLAVTTPVDSIWANPKEINLNKKTLQAIADLLQLPTSTIAQRIKHNNTREFVYLKRQVQPDLAKQVEKLAIRGIYLQREYRRYYPTGVVSGHLIGFTDLDDHGREGLELAYDNWLQGKPGSKRVIKDRLGRIVKDVERIHEPEQGNLLVTSIDRRLQYIAYRELTNAVINHKAAGGSIVILDVNTGEILAMANQPTYNPNNLTDRASARSRNRAVTDLFEPGSVIKPLSMATLLETGAIQSDIIVDTSPGIMYVGRKKVRDPFTAHHFGLLDLAGILAKSSNVGITKLFLMQNNPLVFNEMLFKLGFASITSSGFPGERSGHVVTPNARDIFSLSTQLFGYSFSATMLQVAQAYAVFGTQGIKLPVTFIKQDSKTTPKGERVFSATIAQEMLDKLTMIQVSSKAQISGYTVAGKTGTVRKNNPNGGYFKDKYRSVFAGLVPATNPKFIVTIMIDEPSNGEYYGNLVAAPVFSKVMASALRLYNIPPDNLVAKIAKSKD